MSSSIGRRDFLRASAGACAAMAAPTILTASKTDSSIILGDGEHRYEVIHDWPKLPEKFTWQTTHNVAIDKASNLYVIHEGKTKQAEHPSIFVFDPEGRYVRSFGKEFQGGGHGLEVHEENGEEFLYVSAYQHLKKFAKLTLDGETVWERRAPMESGIYAAGEDTKPDGTWGRNRFMPTNFAFHPENGDFYVADGYGAYAVHRYDRRGNYQSTFGKPGKGDGQFDTPHGIWIDRRPGREASIVVADRANGRLQWFNLDGEHLETIGGFLLPANVDFYGDVLLVPDLRSRVTLLDVNNKVVAQLGDDAAWREKAFNEGVRGRPSEWPAGKFIHPHDACFDADGNIFVAEWVATGRISKLRRVS
jgi:hypothetical protein